MAVTYSAAQQAQINAAQQAVKDANTALVSANSDYNAAYNVFCNNGWWQYLTDCDIRNVQSYAHEVSVTVANLYTFGLPTLFGLNHLTQKKWDTPSSCQDALDKGVLTSWQCNHNYKGGDCQKASTCDSKVSDYNTQLQLVYTSLTAVGGAKTAYDTANNNLINLMKSLQQDPNVISQQNDSNSQVQADANTQRTKWIFFGIIAIVLVVAALLAGKMLLSHKSI